MAKDKDFQWESEFKIGVNEIDKQHKSLLKLLEGLPRLLLTNEEERNETFKAILMKVLECLQFHFLAEERLMQEVSYPGLMEHKTEHVNVFKKLYVIAHNTDADSATMRSTIDFLSEWYRAHFLGMDKEMGEYYNRKA